MSMKNAIPIGVAGLFIIVSLALAFMQTRGSSSAGPSSVRESPEPRTGLPGTTPVPAADNPDAARGEPKDGARMEKLDRILQKMREKDPDTGPALKELVRRLKESPDGKLSREEVRRILPRGMAKDFDEFMAIIQSDPGGGRL